MKKLLPYVFIIISVQLYGQSNYSKARELALNGVYDQAIQLCMTTLKETPNNLDINNLQAWIYSLKGENHMAIELYKTSLDLDSNNYDALEGIIRTYQKTKEYDKSLKYSNIAVKNYPRNTTFLWFKIQNLNFLNQPTEALYFIDQFLNIDPSNENAKDLRAFLKDQALTHIISIGYTRDSYEDYYDPLNNVQAEYQSLTSWGTLSVRIQTAQRNSQKGYQYEIESYPRFWKGSYGFVHLALSNKTIFPNFRYGLDINQSFLKTFGAGIGFRSLHFSKETVNLLKVTVEKYFKSYRLEATLFKGPSDYGNTYTYLASVRNYFNKSTDYIYITFGNGISPDTQGRLSYSGEIYKLKNKQFIAGFRAKIFKNTIMFSNLVLLENELPFDLGNSVIGHQLNIGYQFKF